MTQENLEVDGQLLLSPPQLDLNNCKKKNFKGLQLTLTGKGHACSKISFELLFLDQV